MAKNAKVYMACRSEAKGQAAIDKLEKETGKRALYLKLDLSDLRSVEAAAHEFLWYVLKCSPHITLCD